MKTISLVPHMVRVLDRTSQQPQNLSEFTNNLDILDQIVRYLQTSLNAHINLPSQQKVFQLSSYEVDGRRVRGVLHAGGYGYGSDLVNASTGDEEFQRSIGTAELIPFYFEFWIPEGTDEGVLILQKLGISSINKGIYHLITKKFHDRFRNRRLAISPVVEDRYIQEMIDNWRVERLRFIRYSLPRDAANALRGQPHSEHDCDVEFSIRAKRRQSLGVRSVLRNVFQGREHYSDILEWNNYQYDTVKVEFEDSGRQKTINFEDILNIKAGHDITNEVEYDERRHPTYDSLVQQSDVLIGRLRGGLNL